MSDQHAAKDGLICTIEDQLFDLITPDIKDLNQVFGPIVATGSVRLVEKLHSTIGRTIEIDRQSWAKLLEVAPFHVVDAFTTGQLSLKNGSCALLQASIPDNTVWAPILRRFEQQRVYEKDILKVSRQGLMLHPKLCEPVSSFIRGQIKVEPGRYEELAKSALGQKDLMRGMIVHLAGISLEDIMAAPPHGTGLALKNMTSSAHGKLAVMGMVSCLEAVLAQPERIERLQRAIDRT